MLDNMLDAQFPGHINGTVTAFVIYENYFVHDVERDLSIGLGQGLL